jgi:hypothetical protein
MKDWFIICIIAALVLAGFGSMISCMDKDHKKRMEHAKQNPIKAAKDRCWTKNAGSRPACWTEADWEIYCQRVECKQTVKTQKEK